MSIDASSQHSPTTVLLATAAKPFDRVYVSAVSDTDVSVTIAGNTDSAHGTIEYASDPSVANSSSEYPIGTRVNIKWFNEDGMHAVLASTNITGGNLAWPGATGDVQATKQSAGVLPEILALNTAATASGHRVSGPRVHVEPTMFIGFTGRNLAGAITLAGTKVGDINLGAYNFTDGTVPANDGTIFEATITVAGQIQQASATDLSAKKHLILIGRARV